MPKAAFCSECKRVVWMTDTGCENGHPMSCLRGVYETDSIEVAASSAPGPDDAIREYKLRSQSNAMALWLFLIGGSTLFNALSWLSQQSLRLVIGIFSTRALTTQVPGAGASGAYIVLAAAIVAAVVFFALGWLVHKRHVWALRAAIVLYAADLLVLVAVMGTRDMLGLLFHLFTLVMLTVGYLLIIGQRANSDPMPRAAV